MSDSPAARLATYATPTLFEVDEAVQALGSEIAPLFRPIRLAGAAYTVLAAPGDNLPIHLALAEAPVGSVLMVATGPDREHGFWGEIMLEAARARGIAGLVIDGAVRDTEAIRRSGFPVFCAGIAIPGTGKVGRGERQLPITVAGARVQPGDWIVGDDDGVVAVPPDAAEQVIVKAQTRLEKEAAIMERLRAGELTLDLLGLRPLVEGSRDG